MTADIFSIEGKVVIITGAGRGIGRTVAIGMAERNAFVYAVDIIYPNKISESHAKFLFEEYCDITIQDKFKSVCEKIFKIHKKIDVLINNAGITYTKNPDELYPIEQWNRTININLTAAFTCSQIVFKFMERRKQGSIINITSLNADLAFPNNPAYVASKGGLKMLGKALARDWGKYGIRVNNMGPGYIRTQMTEKSYTNQEKRKTRESRIMLGRWGTPDDLIGPCVFLASDASKYITAQDIYVDGGWLSNGLNEEIFNDEA